MNRLLLLAALAMISGCTCKKSEPPAVVAPPPAPKPQPLSAPEVVDAVPDASVETAVVAATDDAPPPEDDADAGATIDPVDAYRENCAYQFQSTVDSMGEPVTDNECTNREFEQNCSPDSCWDDAEACKDKCGLTCKDCQADCADSCQSCKDDCSVDGGEASADCITQCAQARADCRDSCIEQTGRCQEGDCSVVYDTCTKDAARRLKENCPDCDKLMSCMQKANGSPDKCLKKYPRNAAECAELCFGQ